MTIEKEIYKGYKADNNKLIKYGFEAEKNKLVYEKKLLNEEFKIVVEFDNGINARVYDTVADEEYTNFRIEKLSGFSSQIREEFIALLKDIRQKCFEKEPFQSKQTLEINRYIREKYQDEAEFLWERWPTYAIYRNKKNAKWYAIVGTVEKNKVDKKSKSKEIVEIMNFKVDKNRIKTILEQKGIYEAYHMNKKNWVSVIMDNTLKTSAIKELLIESYKSVES